MKICAACHANLPKESYSKKQWKLDQRRCKVCTTNKQETQPISTKQDNGNDNELIKSLDSMYLEGTEKKTSDEELFKQPPPGEDCPICFLLLPTFNSGCKYQTCCGKVICSGCIHAPLYDNQGNVVDNEKCPFCRTPQPTSDEEVVERIRKRVEINDPAAIYNLGCFYSRGSHGFPQDYTKALKLYHRAGELGYANAYNHIGNAYHNGRVVEIDKKKAKYYYQLAAIEGDSMARNNLGICEACIGNMDSAIKHFMIAIQGCRPQSLNMMRKLYRDGYATKDDYMKALQTYQTYLSEIKSSQRDEAAAFDSEQFRYY